VLILVRHGQTVPNREGRLLGRDDAPLTDVGRQQAEATARAVREQFAVTRVISSPLSRARDTAALLGLNVEVDERWIEVDYGEYDGLPFAEVPEELWREWRADLAWVPPQGESLAAVGKRVRAACDDLTAEVADRDVVVVSHVSPIKAALAWALDVSDDVSWHMRLDVTSICTVSAGSRGTTLHTFNQTHHLQDGR
jgi:broad specificity phosphatase PhoE